MFRFRPTREQLDRVPEVGDIETLVVATTGTADDDLQVHKSCQFLGERGRRYASDPRDLPCCELGLRQTSDRGVGAERLVSAEEGVRHVFHESAIPPPPSGVLYGNSKFEIGHAATVADEVALCRTHVR